MIGSLRLENFKSFETAELKLGPLTVLAGTNASGKSNLIEAFRFLHAVARGYTLGRVFDGKRGDRDEIQWDGIRGGAPEAAFMSKDSFLVTVRLHFVAAGEQVHEAQYAISVDVSDLEGAGAAVAQEVLMLDNRPILWSKLEEGRRQVYCLDNDTVVGAFPPHQPFLGRARELFPEPIEHDRAEVFYTALQTVNALLSFRFMDLHAEAMRAASYPEETVLGDGGENLSTVLKIVAKNSEGKQFLMDCVREQTLMDITNMEFIAGDTGKILLWIEGSDGHRTSIQSLSDGTLRFLAVLAMLLGPEPAECYFLEELEGAMHPTRLHLLMNLIENNAAAGTVQIVATTHSSQLLTLLSQETLEHASVTYRPKGHADTRVKSVFEVIDRKRVLEEQYVARLQSSSGWLNEILRLSERESEKT